MRLTIVGCSGSMPRPGSASSCYLIEHRGTRVVLDLGSGSIGALQEHTDLTAIDAIVLSHLHADHCLDACAYVVWHRYSRHSRGPVPLYGPAGTRQRLAAAYEHPAADLDDVFEFHELSETSVLSIGELTLSFTLANHPVPTYAVRVDAGTASVTYSADTGVCADLVGLARGSDLFLCEAAQPSGESGYPPGLHLTGGQAGEHAAAAQVGRLLLTHVPPWVDADAQLSSALAVFAASELVKAGTTYDL